RAYRVRRGRWTWSPRREPRCRAAGATAAARFQQCAPPLARAARGEEGVLGATEPAARRTPDRGAAARADPPRACHCDAVRVERARPGQRVRAAQVGLRLARRPRLHRGRQPARAPVGTHAAADRGPPEPTRGTGADTTRGGEDDVTRTDTTTRAERCLREWA